MILAVHYIVVGGIGLSKNQDRELSEDPQFQADSILGDDSDMANEEPRCDRCHEYYAYCNCELDDDERSYF